VNLLYFPLIQGLLEDPADALEHTREEVLVHEVSLSVPRVREQPDAPLRFEDRQAQRRERQNKELLGLAPICVGH
jgi:hypothetical protein